MFTDIRSKKIVLVSHCILNQNSISDGTADYPCSDYEVVNLFLNAGVGIIQMPCPELNCLGLDRGDKRGSDNPVIIENSRIRKSMNKKDAKEILNGIVLNLVYQIEEYIKYDIAIIGIVGINRSPSCGVETTSKDNMEIEGTGVLISVLQKELKKRKIVIPFVGIKAAERNKSLKSVKRLLL
jgi:predicted secreted protein